MMRRGGIFLQTFIWFWIITTTVVATLYAIHEMTETTSRKTHVKESAQLPLSFFAKIAVERYERADKKGLAEAIGSLKSSTGIDAYFLDEKGTELTGREVPPSVLALSAQTDREGEVVVDLSHNEDEDYAALRITGAGGRSYVIAGTIPEKDYRGMSREILVWIIRLLVVLIVSSIACYLLSRYMTRPIIELREAAKRLASGDLAARVAPAVGARGDEIGELARDFDVMAERVEALLTSQRQLLGNISHELRSPLSRISVALELAGRHSTPEAERYLGRIEVEAERLNELIGRLLAFTRLESGLNIKKEPFDLAGILSEVAADADFEGQSSGKTVRVVQSEQCIVSGVRELIYSAIENVVRNAVRYTAEGTEVEIALRCIREGAAHLALMEVRDHGPGVPENDLRKLFRPFYRVGEGRERQTGGTGLGLAITERAILLHGGSVKAVNVPDGGLAVEIILPMIAEN